MKVISSDGTSVTVFLDFDSPANEMLVRICNVAKQPVDDMLLVHLSDPEQILKLSLPLGEQGVTEDSLLALRSKAEEAEKEKLQKKKRSAQKKEAAKAAAQAQILKISEPMFVKSTRSEFDDDESDRTKGRKIFGKPIAVALTRSGKRVFSVPPIISRACEWIEANGLDVEGIFRISPKSDDLERLRQHFDSTEVDPDFDKLDEGRDSVHLVAGMLKLYLRMLPEPVIPFKMYPLFVMMADGTPNDEEMDLQNLIVGLPLDSKLLLKKLLGLLEKVAEQVSENKMTPMNLATVFGPNILRMEDESDMMRIVHDSPKVNRIMVHLITHATSVFGLGAPAPPSRDNQPSIPRKLKSPRGSSPHAQGFAASPQPPRLRNSASAAGVARSELRQPPIDLSSSAPEQRARIAYVRALHAYKAAESKEISLEEGDVVTVIEQDINGWWKGKVGSGPAGYFPAHYCTRAFASEEQLALSLDLESSDPSSPGNQRGRTGSSPRGPKSARKKRTDSAGPLERVSDLEEQLRVMQKEMKKLKKQLKDEAQLREELTLRVVRLEGNQ
eukprot:TRINITY_DN5251_c0_g1_i1.p1 TRINITY_DN5251_c0_g1~~TRINITY_DN5251_c0_g1_i1.p1  ORF type:complete len:556 (+),score=145.84 TRINITY_DN5251_c0_g1_i1:236-1903(+)